MILHYNFFSFHITDCGTPSATEGYTLGTVGLTTFGKTVSFTCATGYTGDAGSISCTASETWSAPSGCARVGKLSETVLVG